MELLITDLSALDLCVVKQNNYM